MKALIKIVKKTRPAGMKSAVGRECGRDQNKRRGEDGGTLSSWGGMKIVGRKICMPPRRHKIKWRVDSF
jgi:hypothetical protein